MQEVKKYICEYCGTEYKEKEECGKCEEKHQKPTGIVGAKYENYSNSKYPEYIDILMNDGVTVRYMLPNMKTW